ncbi:RidA family protein [Mucilaginibacter auburnensis]|uniref:2-iminobutanoate/2-iminopropanoate deaminase n=1 Tax=Mucilaginibacter auburnensis TaxID=1457233 RepID=A0A2H9VP87_9SPHI|nr:RidA family protein [Mucilaginibacter auburnensis]PJJ80145.1 2-iminobutanoate/2-iminopropanoate deaminase [Mucilaginibacter auburnensis]
MKTVVTTNDAPPPIGPYSQAIIAGNLIFVSGQIPLHPFTNELVTDNISSATHLVMENIGAILEGAGAGFEHILKTTIFLKNMGDFAEVNEVYGTYFEGDFPARETVQAAALPKGVSVEISVIAVKP